MVYRTYKVKELTVDTETGDIILTAREGPIKFHLNTDQARILVELLRIGASDNSTKEKRDIVDRVMDLIP